MASVSLNDLVAALHATFAHADAPQALPDELARILAQYAAKARKEGDGLHEELQAVFRNHVQAHANRLPAFVSVLKALRPAIVNEDHLAIWFQSAAIPFVDLPATSRSAASDAQDFVLDSLCYDNDSQDARDKARAANRLSHILLDALIARTTALPDNSPVHTQDHAARQLQSMLIAFARKNPRDFFVSIDHSLLKPETRLQALDLLAAFLEQQHAHLYLVLDTTVVEHLLKCLMNDTATVVVSAALKCLIMLLPHIPATVASQLPRLFLVYSRCLCWEKFSASSTKAQRDLVTDDRVRRESDSDADTDYEDGSDPTWQTLRALPDMPESSAPELLHYFTYLYGLYPLNFMSYVRKPRKYLKNIDFPGADEFDLDQTVIRSRTEQFQRVHFLHPSFFATTVEEELSENRWLKAEPSEVIAECHGLYAGEHPMFKSPAPPPSTKLPAVPSFLASSLKPPHPDSPTLPHHPEESPVESAVDPTSSKDLSYLQRELMLLRNELTFERYLKQQHVAAIGQLKRNHIKAVTLSDSNKFNEKMQKETQARRNHTKQSEEQLMAKIRALKSELADQETLQLRLTQVSKDCDQLRLLLVESESRESNKQEGFEALEARLKNQEAVDQQTSDLQKELRNYRDQNLALESIRVEHELAKQELDSTKFILQRREQELERLKTAYEAKMQEYDLRLKEVTESSSAAGQPIHAIPVHLHDQLSESRLRLAQSKAAYSQLLEEYTDLRESKGSADAAYPLPSHSGKFGYMNQEGSVRSYAPAYYTDRGNQFDLFAPHMEFGRTASPVSSLNQSYPPQRPLRPEAYSQRIRNAHPMSRAQSIHYSEHALHPGAARSMFGSDQSSPPPSSLSQEGNRSVFSFNSEVSEEPGKESGKPKPEVRMYGRGKSRYSEYNID
ncbi:unnamed protein product [Aureobasidium uvarum]|uniref:Hamartin n=1 Tax=Aureobasidium uvarum TaxID=2773716 RepID=A0A9N8KHZ9_9PEZI|nr:unnamed protein product [Aureobasidium uvarum]